MLTYVVIENNLKTLLQMYYIIGAAFCIGFVVGMAFGIVRGKKELAAEIQQHVSDSSQEIQQLISGYLK